MKKLSFVLALVLLFTACGAPVDVSTDEGKVELESAVADALYDYHRDMYENYEPDGLGYVIMGQELYDGKIYVYTINSYGVYEEIDGAMKKTLGHSCIPMVVILNEKDLEPVEVREPNGDETYRDSAKELFPVEYHDIIFDIAVSDYSYITTMEAECIKEYLGEKDLEVKY